MLLCQLRHMIYAYVQFLFHYGIIGWGGASRTLIESLSVVQKLIIKAGINKRRRHPWRLVLPRI